MLSAQIRLSVGNQGIDEAKDQFTIRTLIEAVDYQHRSSKQKGMILDLQLTHA
jgi:hypothetical protein